jgi:TatA/E family protein of Tat protein translocase
MGFLGIGAMEALVIMVIALIIFGPGRLPEIMGEAGRTLRDFRRATRELTGDFEETVSDVRGTYRELEEEMRDTATGLRRDAQGMADELNTAVADASRLDGADNKRPRESQPKKLDQMPESAGDGADDVTRYFPPENGKVAASRDTAKVASQSPNGSPAATDDLLAVEDGDDLLASDEPL